MKVNCNKPLEHMGGRKKRYRTVNEKKIGGLLM